jgi:hypothetical protein
MLCETCNVANATVHLTECRVGGENEGIVSHNFCEACYRKRDPIRDEDTLPALETQTCYYCGATADSRKRNLDSELEVRRQRRHCTCRRCNAIFTPFFLEQLQEVMKLTQNLDVPSVTKQVLEQAIRISDHHVRQMIQREAN